MSDFSGATIRSSTSNGFTPIRFFMDMMSYSDFSGVDIEDPHNSVYFRTSNLTHADFSGATVDAGYNVWFGQAVLSYADFSGAVLHGSYGLWFDGTRGYGANFAEASFSGDTHFLIFDGADFSKADFSDATIEAGRYGSVNLG